MSLAGLAPGAARHLAARAAATGLGVAVVVVVARLGPAVQGAFALFLAVEAALLTLCSGFGLALARRISHHGDDGAAPLRAWLRVATAVGVAVALGAWAVAAVAQRPPYADLGWLALAAPVLLWVPTASGLWLGRGQMGRLGAPLVAQPLLTLAGLAAVAAWAGGVGAGGRALPGVLAAWVAARVVVAGVAAAWALREAPARLGAAPAAPAREEWRFVAAVGLANVVSVLNVRAPLFVVEQTQGLAATGVYAVAVQVAELLWLLSSALSVAAYRRIGEPDAARAAATAWAAARVGVVATALAAPLLWALAWAALPPLLGPGYEGVAWPLALLLPGVVGYAAASALSAYYTNHLGRPGWAARIAALSLALNVAGCLWAVPRHGIAGAAASTSASYLIAIGVALLLFRRAARRPAPAPAPVPRQWRP